MTIAQLSNMFNLIVSNTADFKFFHIGWPNDMNLNIQNNSDPSASTGSRFPYLLLLPPRIDSRLTGSLSRSLYKTYFCEFIITDTYAYAESQLTYKSDTTLDVLSKLEFISQKLMNYINQYSDYSDVQFVVSDYKTDLDPYRFSANTRSIRVSFDVTFPSACPVSNLDLSFMPLSFELLPLLDLENLNP